MRIKKVGGRRNFGFGSSLRFAGRCALVGRYGPGSFGAVSVVTMRAMQFVAFLKAAGIKDFRFVSLVVIRAYAEDLQNRVREGQLAVSTAVNYLSAVNCLMEALRSDSKMRVSPSRLIGHRSYVRKTVPKGLDAQVVDDAVDHLVSIDVPLLGAVLLLCRGLGLRFREASLLNIRAALRQARRRGEIQIVKGTKGGRPRTLCATAHIVDALTRACLLAPVGANVIPTDWSFIKWSRYCYREWAKYASERQLSTKFSDLRAAFACQQYFDVAGAEAPVIAGGRLSDRDVDLAARLEIARTLGHSRPQISSAYIGTTLRPKK